MSDIPRRFSRLLRPAVDISDRRMGAWIFLIIWITAVFFGPGPSSSSPNTITRMGLAFSMLQQGSVRIDRFAPYTSDKAIFEGHAYADKAPGQTLVALPFVGATMLVAREAGYPAEPIDGTGFTEFYQLAEWVAVAFTSALFNPAGAACLYCLAIHLGSSRGAALFTSLAFALGTPAIGWSSVLFSHSMTGGCLLLAFAAMLFGSAERPPPRSPWIYGLWTGMALGLAVLTEFTAVIPGVVIGVVGLVRIRALPRWRATRLLAGTLLGGAPFAAVLGFYNLLCFGSPTHLGYGSVVGFDGMQTGFFGISLPKVRVLAMLLIAPRRGILWLAPWLVILPFAWFKALRVWPREVVVATIVIPGCYLLINAGYYYWDGGWSTGPRHLIAALPFACLCFAPLWDAASARLRSVLLAGAGLGAVVSLICISVDMTESVYVTFPLVQHLLPRFVAGDVHNVVAAAGFGGLASLLALPILWGLVTVALLGAGTRSGSLRAEPV